MAQYIQEKLIKFDMPLTDVQILQAFSGAPEWYSRRSIALALGVTKSPTLIKKLQLLVQGGFLIQTFIGLSNQVDMYAYALTEEGHIARNTGAMPPDWEAEK